MLHCNIFPLDKPFFATIIREVLQENFSNYAREVTMENKELVKQMVELHKTSFDNSFNMLVTLQDQMEKMVNSFVDQAPWLPGRRKEGHSPTW